MNCPRPSPHRTAGQSIPKKRGKPRGRAARAYTEVLVQSGRAVVLIVGYGKLLAVKSARGYRTMQTRLDRKQNAQSRGVLSNNPREDARERAMGAYLKAFLFFAFIFSLSIIARLAIAPGIRPIAENAQADWKLQAAFVLKSIEYIGLFGIVILLLLAGFSRLRQR